jgi:hypothetical protein
MGKEFRCSTSKGNALIGNAFMVRNTSIIHVRAMHVMVWSLRVGYVKGK